MTEMAMTELDDYWAAHQELAETLGSIDADDVHLDTCRQVLDVTSQYRDLLNGDAAPMPDYVDPNTIVAADATAQVVFTIAAAGNGARQHGEMELARRLDEIGYTYSLTAMYLYMIDSWTRRSTEQDQGQDHDQEHDHDPDED